MDEEQTWHCEYGDHEGTETVMPCHICGKRCCIAHTANADYCLAGDYVACPDHKDEVDRVNAERWEKFRASVL